VVIAHRFFIGRLQQAIDPLPVRTVEKLELAERAEPQLRDADQAVWLQRLELEHDNLRAALGWSLEHEPFSAVRLSSALWFFWYVRGYFAEGRRWLEHALAAGDAPEAARASVFNASAYLASAQGDLEMAASRAEQALSLWRDVQDTRGIATALRTRGKVSLQLGEHADAERFLQDSLTLHRALGDAWGSAMCLNNLGNLARCQRDFVRAAELYGEALALRRAISDTFGIAVALSNLGIVAHQQGDTEHAIELTQEALELQRQLGVATEIAVSLRVLGMVARERGDDARAAALFEESLELYRKVGHQKGVDEMAANLAHARRGRH
jgi:tetratricopeptide (TPR) repeat protein